MKKRKTIKIIFILLACIALFSIGGVACIGEINAQTIEESEGEYPLFIEKISERFDLDPDEVMDFLKGLREERINNAEEKFEERLDELVEDERITEDQKKAILEKKGELEAFKEGLEDMTIAEAREAIKDMHVELRDWAEENELDLKNFFPKNKAHAFGLRGFKNHRSLFKK